MAVAGLRNVPDFAPRSFIVESQKRDSGRWDDDRCRRSTRASTLLQMWRQIEGEHVLSESYRSRLQSNGSDSECRSIRTSVRDGSENGDAFSPVSYESENQAFSGSDTEHDDDNSVISEQSSELGEVERERVRQIFQGWMNSCPRGDPSYGSKRKNRAPQCASGIESERVKILWERAENTTQPRSLCTSSGAGAAEFGSQTVHSSGGLVVNHPEIGARRPLRRLCGRQTLHDLLLKTQSERKRELLSLSEQKPVSDFAHRNRIQALLRGRFLRNGLVGEERLLQRLPPNWVFLDKDKQFPTLGLRAKAESACIERGDTGNQIAADLEDVVSVCAKRASSVKESVFATEARQHGACSHIEDEDINITLVMNLKSQVSVTEIEESIRQNVNNVALLKETLINHFLDHLLADMPYSEAENLLEKLTQLIFLMMVMLIVWNYGNFTAGDVYLVFLIAVSVRLNQVLLSHVERLENASYPQSEEDPEQLDHEQSLAPSESAERNPFMQSSTLFEASQQLWNDDLEATDSARHYLNQQFGTEWEVINELRMDMARLQQDVAKDNQVHDESQWIMSREEFAAYVSTVKLTPCSTGMQD
ncbi:hypothetical protein SASPL_155949 [Salvia splendens]|uniref:Uncharacterized protein n=1 Tax=Salvia splendens TaxID=180675 RepID=A0A8X8VXF2_SALSN|nr:hypothetical protein SASPL_155949 [Salvia splendens]